MKFDIKTAVITGSMLLALGMLQGSSAGNPNNKIFTNVNQVKVFQRARNMNGKPNEGYTDYSKMNSFIEKHPQGFMTVTANDAGEFYTYTYNK